MAILVRDVMVSKVKCVRSELSVPDLERRFHDEGVDGFAVVDDGVFRGEISRLDILRKLDDERAAAEVAAGFWEEGAGIDAPLPAADWVSTTVGKRMDHLQVNNVMNQHPVTAAPTDLLLDVVKRMIAHRAHRVFVLNARSLVGVLSAYDILRMYADGALVERTSWF